MKKYKRTVGLFYDRQRVKQALLALRNNNFNLDRVTLLGRDSDRVIETVEVDVNTNCDGGNKAAEVAAEGASVGTVLGSVGGLVVGLKNIAIPGIESIVIAGSAAYTIAATLAGAGAGALAGGQLGALIGLNIPEEKAKIYGEIVAKGGYLIMVKGGDKDMKSAEKILRDSGIQNYGIYDEYN